MIRFILFFCVLFPPTMSHAAEDPLAALKEGQPSDVAELVDRLVGCAHWAGEEPYDAERKKQIAQALKELKCDRLNRDYHVLTKRYGKRPKVLEALQKAREFSY